MNGEVVDNIREATHLVTDKVNIFFPFFTIVLDFINFENLNH